MVAARDDSGLVRGLVYQVTKMNYNGLCSLQRAYDGIALEGEFPVSALAVAGDSLGATPLHLAILFGAPFAALSLLVARCPDALMVEDKLGRTPLMTALEAVSEPNPPAAPAL